jgi:hypothetical protein
MRSARAATLRVLVLYWHPKGTEMRLAVRHHLRLLEGRGLRILYRNGIDPAPPRLAWTKPDLCVLHTTFLSHARWTYSFEEYRRRFSWLAQLECPKVALPQDEYDHAAVVDEWLAELGVTSVYSCFGPDQWPTLYPVLSRRAAFHETLTGFIDKGAATTLGSRMVPHTQRPFDIVYRARKLPYWFGSHGQLKHRVAEVVQPRAADLGLRTDISTRPEDTVLGPGWLDFLSSGRAVIGAESGSSVLDARGEIQRRISRLLARQPDLTFDEVDAQMPPGWDSYGFFAISPRHLEAVITKTAQLLVEGRFSGVLEPETHYIPLRRDFSNLDEALERLGDVAAVEAMTERAYRNVYLSGRNDLSVLADQLCQEVDVPGATGVAFPFALAHRPSLPIRAPIDGKPLRRLLPHIVTFAEALALQSEARALVLRALRRRLSVPVENVVREIVLLRVMARIRAHGGGDGESWWLSVDNDEGTIVIRTRVGPRGEDPAGLDGSFEHVVWNHADVAQAVPIYPRHPRWGWIALGLYGRYEFTALAELTRTNARTARTLLARALGDRPLRSTAQDESTLQSEANDQ